MTVSTTSQVQQMYDEIAEGYAEMMSQEIELPIYQRTLSDLKLAIEAICGPILDTSCGSGHLLQRYREQQDPQRELMGMDLSARMVAISQERLGSQVRIEQGDMRTLTNVKTHSLAGVISFFAIHHLTTEELRDAFAEWSRVLAPRGCLLLAAWEGEEQIDYGEAADLEAQAHSTKRIVEALSALGLEVEFCQEQFENDMQMNSVYLRARKV